MSSTDNNMPTDDTKIIKHTITHLLARREHSRVELLQKLRLKEFDTTLSQAMIEKFTQANLQSDSRYAEAVVRTLYGKGKGEYVIRAKLKEHDINEQLIDKFIRLPDYDWFACAEQVYRKKYKNQPFIDWAGRQKRARFLQYRGFTLEQIQYALESS